MALSSDVQRKHRLVEKGKKLIGRDGSTRLHKH